MSSTIASVIIPCHNAAPWLATTLESALALEPGDHEIIVVDDGSTDNSVEVARVFEARGVRLIRQANAGAAAARNRGFVASRGRYIQFLDADDLLAPDKISLQLERLERAPTNMIASAEWSRFHQDPAEAQFTPEPNWRDLSGVEFQLMHYERGWMMQPGAWLCPRTLLEKVGGWDETLSLNDDGEYFNRVMLASAGILFCPGARVYYRSGISGSLSRRASPAAMRSLERSTELNLERLLAAAGDSPRVRAAAANGWQRLMFQAWPSAPRISRAAEKKCQELGGSPFPLPAGPAFQRMARWLGWRLAKRVRDTTARFRKS